MSAEDEMASHLDATERYLDLARRHDDAPLYLGWALEELLAAVRLLVERKEALS